MVDTSKIADNYCIFWDQSGNLCQATSYYNQDTISCFDADTHGCKADGKCLDCSKYNVGGLQYGQLNTLTLYNSGYEMEWSPRAGRYLPISVAGDYDSSLATNSYSLQTPINIAIYNLRAQAKKCCNWAGSPLEFFVSASGDLYVISYSEDGSTKRVLPYLYIDNGVYINVLATTKCKVSAALPWILPNTASNQTDFGCNGCKPECPYYTGPKWSYCIDDKMQAGDAVSAAQILELRYYSRDWSSYGYPYAEWKKAFAHYSILAWTGDYTSDNIPIVQDVSITAFDTIEPNIEIGPRILVDTGVEVFASDTFPGSYSYPTLIHEIEDSISYLRVTWPYNTSHNAPYAFKFWDIDNAYVRIFFEASHLSTVYAVNMSEHSQGGFTDEQFLTYMLNNYSSDIYSTTPSLSDSLYYIDIPLSIETRLNHIKLFTRDIVSGDSSYLTADCFIDAVLYHAVVAQTEGNDFKGHTSIQPWIDRFDRVGCKAKFYPLSNAPAVYDVLWDTFAGGALTIYPIETVVTREFTGDSVVSLGCGYLAVVFDDIRCNPVMPWVVSGQASDGSVLGAYIDRTGRDDVSGDQIVELTPVFKNNAGKYIPANMVIFKDTSSEDTPSFDSTKDTITITYAVTEYKQAPVSNDDLSLLKYPSYQSIYMSDMPYDIVYDESGFSVDGKSVCIRNRYNPSDTRRLYGWDEIRDHILYLLQKAEDLSIESFFDGGLFDSQIDTSASIFSVAQDSFNEQYKDYVFCNNGEQVTLFSLCERFSYLWANDGDLLFSVIFKDEEGRPIGVKRVYMLLQSAVVETRDVEIKYAWETKYLVWPIVDSFLLLAKFSEPSVPGDEYVGVSTYEPKCGDHSEYYYYTRHDFGDPGAMWYPYISCYPPEYNLRGGTDAIKCQNPVEGFGEGYDGIRWDYWEKMRSHDKLDTFVVGPIFLVGCFYREVSYSFQHKDPVFSGFTRIRSSHPDAPFARDREALRLSRHYIKRDLTVHTELTAPSDDVLFSEQFSDEYMNHVFIDPSDPSKGILKGDDQKTGVWVHILDGVSEVKYTSQEAEHPFTHWLLNTVGSYSFAETFDSSKRYSLSDVLSYRDLTSSTYRNTDGSGVYVPEELDTLGAYQEYSDLIPVFVKQNTAWAWLEKQKDIDRVLSGDRVTGISVSNPTKNVWRTDFASAVCVDEGEHTLTYSPPSFNNTTGVLESYPYIQLDDGPPQYIDWPDGSIYYPTSSVYSYLSSLADFTFYGNGEDGVYFLMDSSGIHRYVDNISNEGVTYGRTVRGISFDPNIDCAALPYEISDLVDDNINVRTGLSVLDAMLSAGRGYAIDIGCGGVYYIDQISVNWKVGAWSDVFYTVPSVSISTYDGTKYTEVYNQSPLLFGDQVVAGEHSYGTIYYDGAGYSLRKEIGVGQWASSIKFSISAAIKGRASIYDVVIKYRKPKSAVEVIKIYEQKVSISEANTGSPDYRHMLYYYSRDNTEYGADISYNILMNEGQLDNASALDLVSNKFTTRTVKDVVLEYDYSNVSGRRFPYKDSVRPENSPLVSVDPNGVASVAGNIRISTKGSTLLAGSHVEDNPHWVRDGDSLVKNAFDSAPGETTSCGPMGNRVLNEDLQECLYEEAERLSFFKDTEFDWFWHPDEISFWTNTVGVSLPDIPSLVLTSSVASLDELFRMEFFGCTSFLSVPYFDGRTHSIPQWSALGHRLYTGNPMFNHACFDVVLFKVQDHIGERTYGTSKYGEYSEDITWPYQTYRDKFYYLNAGLVEKGGYIGGAIGGVGPAFWAAQTQLSHGFTLPQIDTKREVDENVIMSRAEAVRAEGSSVQ